MPRPSRGAFVGREAEFSELAGGVDETIEGQGRGFLVLGEAGIGKTRLASEVADHARSAGVLVLWGRCWEAGDAPPYWPWTEVVRAAGEVDGMARAASPALAALLPEAGTPYGWDDPSRARFELFEAVGSYLKRASTSRPMLLVIDDLHAADLASLLLLEYLLGGGLRHSRVMILALARDHELGSADELRVAALRVRRVASSIRLHGLPRAAVAELIEQRVAVRPSPHLVEVVSKRTEGNPLFVEELAALLSQMDGVDIPVFLPAGIRETIRQRLRPFPAHVLTALSAGAVMGRDFDAALVARVVERDLHHVLTACDDATRAGVLTLTQRGWFRFSHVLVRDVLYDGLPGAERARLHAQVGRALEERQRPELDEDLDQLAHHFREAVPAGEEERAVDYLLRAGERAEVRLAHELAVRHYEDALPLIESSGRGGAGRLCDVLISLGRAYDHVGRTERAKDVFRRAGGIARLIDDGERFASAALGLTERIAFQQQDNVTVAVLEEALASLPEGASVTRARLLGALARILGYSGHRDKMEALARQAVEVARVVCDPRALGDALAAWQVTMWTPDRVAERVEVAGEMLAIAEHSGDRERVLDAHMTLMICQLEVGNGRAFDRSLAAYARVADELRQPRYRFVALARRAMREMMRGDFGTGRALAEEARRLGLECEDPDAEPVYHGVLALPARDVGDGVALVERFFIDFSSRHTSAGSRALLALLAVEREDWPAARSELAALTRMIEHLPKDMDWLLCLSFAAEVACALDDAATAEALYELLVPYGDRCALMAGAVGFAGSVSHYLGMLAAALGRIDDAVRHFAEAEATHADLGAKPWVIRTQIERGRAVAGSVETDVRSQAAAWFASARSGAEELGLAGLLRRLPVPTSAATPTVAPAGGWARLRREGAQWLVSHGDKEFLLEDSKGLRHLATLISRSGREVHVLDLVKAESGVVLGGDAGAVLDGAARKAYRRRLEELRDDLEEAEAWADGERAARVRAEIDAISHELAAAVGLGGRDRRAGDVSDRARISVRKAVVRALREIERHDPDLGRYLTTTIRTGTYCAYEPDPRFSMTWDL